MNSWPWLKDALSLDFEASFLWLALAKKFHRGNGFRLYLKVAMCALSLPLPCQAMALFVYNILGYAFAPFLCGILARVALKHFRHNHNNIIEEPH